MLLWGCGVGAALPRDAAATPGLPCAPSVGSPDFTNVLSCIISLHESHGQKPLGNWNLAVVLKSLRAG